MNYLVIYCSPGYPHTDLKIQIINAINIAMVDGESDLNAMGLESRLPNHVVTRYYSGSHIDWIFSNFVFESITYENNFSDHDGIIASVPI